MRVQFGDRRGQGVSRAKATDIARDEQRRIEAAKRGELAALRPLFEQSAGPLLAKIILPRVGDRADAEDVLRETITAAVSSIGGYQWTGRPFYVWLRAIAINKANDLLRRRKRARAIEESLAADPSVIGTRFEGAAEQLIAAQERERSHQRIRETLEQLSPRYRRAIALRLLEERSRAECAELMSTSVATFDVVFFRALRAFRKNYGSSK